MRRALGFLGDWGVALLRLAYLLALGPLVPGLLSAPNLGNVVSNVLPLLAVALGQTLVLVTGGIDLSVTATVALASVAGAKVMTETGGPPGQRAAPGSRPCWRSGSAWDSSTASRSRACACRRSSRRSR